VEKAAQRTFVSKICAKNVDEIDHRCTLANPKLILANLVAYSKNTYFYLLGRGCPRWAW